MTLFKPSGRVCAILVCFSAALAVAVINFPVQKANLDCEPTERNIHDVIAQGQPIVVAIYRFKKDHGMWPHCLEDLIPDYIGTHQLVGWVFQWQSDGWWKLFCPVGFPDWAIGYSVGGNDKGWVVTDGVDATPINVEQPLVADEEMQDELCQRHQLCELRRRTKLTPPQLIHYQGLVSLYYKRNEMDAAREICSECLSRWPEHWWPNLMLANIDCRRGDLVSASTRLRKWADTYRDFPHYCFLATFYHEIGDHENTAKTIQEAIGSSLENLRAVSSTGEVYGMEAEYFAWKASLIAYKENRFDLVFAICERWETFNKEERQLTGDRGYHAIRAACYLNQGEYEKAALELRFLRSQSVGVHSWSHNLDLLDNAIKKKSIEFRYQPSNMSSSFELLVDYK